MATSYYNQKTDQITGRFDINKFNAQFDEYLAKEHNKRLVTDQKYLESKTVTKRDKLLHELTFFELVVGMKNNFFDLLDDITSGNINNETWTKNNRLFYIGLLIVIFAVSLVCINIVFD